MRPRLRVGSTDIGIAYNVADERSVPLGRLNETIGNMVRAVPKIIGDDVRQVPELGRALVAVGLFSALINVLYLTGSFYMMQVYDRAIPSRNIPTLVALSVLALILYVGQCAIDLSRQRVLSRMARLVDERLSPRVFRLLSRLPLTSGGAAIGLQPVRDLDQIRNFLAGGGPLGFLDLPWMPFYLGICFLFHPAIGVAALAGAVILLCLTIITQVMTRKSIDVATQLGGARMSLGESSRRNAEVVAAMGMGERLSPVWDKLNQMYLDANQRGNDVAGGLGGVSRVARMALQSGVLGLGAYLVIQGEASAGVIIAASILSARALAPVELVIANWKGFTSARQSWSRLRHNFSLCPEQNATLPLPMPRSALSVEGVSLVPPGGQRAVVRDVSFRLEAGSALGIVGPSASGKSSLARALVGVWRPVRGVVRLDGAALDQWSSETLGSALGYLPQDIQLFEGTVAQNISRFEQDADPEAVIRAAEQAGVHEMVVQLPNGYETRIGEGGAALSGGQKQRIALARALYGDPFLVVLDEPNSNLDTEGEQALTRAIANVRARSGIAIVIAHRPSALAAINQVLVMADGAAKAFGPKEQIMRPAAQPRSLSGAGEGKPVPAPANSGVS